MNSPDMSNLQMIKELCEICAQQSGIIAAQADALAQMGAVCMEEERAAAAARLSHFLATDEVPDEFDAEAVGGEEGDFHATDHVLDL